MESKKISFGFMKTKKQDKPILVERKEYIDCLEEKSIKMVGGESAEEIQPLVIPMKANTLITAEKLKAIAEKVENFDEPVVVKQEKVEDIPNNETLDQMAVRELMEGAKNVKVEDTPALVVPVNVKPVFEGQVESTLDDYESVPIQDFGLAMLRGMGWSEGKEQSKYKQPQLRPKGLGLGADKVVKENQKNKSSNDEELSIVKNAYVKITSGKYSGYYGKVISLDEHNGRVVVDIIMKRETVSLSEFMMQPVTKAEFDKQSKVINSQSYEEYKNNERLNTKPQNSMKPGDRKDRNDGSSNKQSNDKEQLGYRKDRSQEENRKKDINNSNGRSRTSRSLEVVERGKDRYKRDSSVSKERSHRKSNKKRYSSNDSLSSNSNERKKSISRRQRSVSSSESSDSSQRQRDKRRNKEKKDIDKKRKGKKKKKDRDRSPNYKKHRK
ncbi:G-patch domain and KOW motifs-containing protein [Danaus plexippus]|uniref:G-patch domain and KOW motifs-containing protein n=1 Tax=Danaus plexippus TaxID=13037 RepID=UPI002AB1AC22|nr:G-patch domain and KOW motifs-containing protein [Danaus plexippus]